MKADIYCTNDVDDVATVDRCKKNVVHCPGCGRTYPNLGILIICDCGAEIEPKEVNQ